MAISYITLPGCFLQKKWPFLFLAFMTLLCSLSVKSQHDSLVLKNNNIIVGELKSLKNGIITIETDYSDKDFLIEWSGVKEIYSKTRFLLTLKNGTRITGYIVSAEEGKKLKIIEDSDSEMITTLEDLVFLKELDNNFWGRVRANFDLGLNLTKANNLRQFNLSGKLGYIADRWSSDANFNLLRSSQDSVNATKRTDASVNFVYYLQHAMFISSSVNFLSNTEQALKLRTTGKLGFGKFFVQTNRAYWGAGGGLSFNNESFFNETEARNSLELYLATEAKLFDIGDFNFYGNWSVYKSLTESGRWRSDLTTDAKYDLPLDFYLKLNFTVNYDNRPAIVGNDFDYIFGFSFGWKL
jgi:Protein of unknown function, DUF481